MRASVMRGMRAASAVRDPLFTDVSKEPRSPCTRQKRRTRGRFDVDSRWAAFRMAAEALLATLRPRSSPRRHTRRTCTQGRVTVCTWSVRGGGRRKTIFHQTGGVGCEKRTRHVAWNQQQPAAQNLNTPARSAVWTAHPAVFIILYLTT